MAKFAPDEAALVGAVYDEATLLDAKRYDEWLALFTAEGRYWVPLDAAQTDPIGAQSIASEDRLLLEVRIERLRAGRAPSQQQPVVSQHVLQAPAIEAFDPAANRFVTRTAFVYIEARADTQTLLAGTVRHEWTFADGAFKLALKRVDLLNASAMLPPIFLFP